MVFSSERVIPVGYPCGIQHGDSARSAPSAFLISGGQYFELQLEEYAMWTLGFECLDESELMARAQEIGINDPASRVRDLVDQQLVTTLSADLETDRPVLGSHRLLPLVIGLGNTRESRDWLRLGHNPERVVCQVEPLLYSLVTRSASMTSCWDLCETIAKETGSELRDVTATFTAGICGLLPAGAAFLDHLL